MVVYESSILETVREVVVGESDNTDFDADLKMHINGSLVKLNQIGVGKHLLVQNADQQWVDFMDETQVNGNRYFSLVLLFVYLNTKLLFDPPPPSSVEYHSSQINELLWRLQVVYDER